MLLNISEPNKDKRKEMMEWFRSNNVIYWDYRETEFDVQTTNKKLITYMVLKWNAKEIEIYTHKRFY